MTFTGPLVDSIEPHTAPTAGGKVLSISGQNFGFKISDIEVFVGPNPCNNVAFAGSE